MKFPIIITALVLMPVFYLLGDMLGRRGNRVRVAGFAAGILVLLFYVFLCYRSDVEVLVFPFTGYVYLARFWLGWPAMFLLGLAARSVEPQSTKRMLRLLAIAAIPYFAWIFFQFALPPDYNLLEGAPNSKTGICEQSTGFTCGACAAVMLLDKYGIMSTESEMARLMDTRVKFGVCDFAIWAGLKKKLAGKPFNVSVRKMDYDELLAYGKPCVVRMSASFLADHAVCVFEARPDGVTVGDPLHENPVKMARKQFLERWRGFAIVLEKTGE